MSYHQHVMNFMFLRIPLLSIIEVETISGPAYITPVFRTDERIPICERPSRSDNFWFIDRTFFDRAGLDDIHTINIETNIDLHDYKNFFLLMMLMVILNQMM